MKAVHILEQGGIDKLIYGDLPDPEPGPGEVLVRLHAAALNHIDIYARSGRNRVRVPSFPHVLGSDMAGEVTALGTGVHGVSVGQRVLINRDLKCGACEQCVMGRDESCVRQGSLGGSAWGGYAQYVKAPAQNIYTIPDEMSFQEAAAIPLCFHGAWHCLVTRVGLRPGETVLINAAGSGVGSAALQIALALKARVLVTAGSDAKVATAVEMGAEAGINYTSTPDFSKRVLELTDGEGVDIVFDSVGAPVWRESFASLKRGGRLVCTGVTGGHRAELHLGQLFTRGLTLMGSGRRSHREFAEFMRLVNRGVLHGVVGRVLALEDAGEAHRLMEERDFFGKIVLDIQ